MIRAHWATPPCFMCNVDFFFLVQKGFKNYKRLFFLDVKTTNILWGPLTYSEACTSWAPPSMPLHQRSKNLQLGPTRARDIMFVKRVCNRHSTHTPHTLFNLLLLLLLLLLWPPLLISASPLPFFFFPPLHFKTVHPSPPSISPPPFHTLQTLLSFSSPPPGLDVFNLLRLRAETFWVILAPETLFLQKSRAVSQKRLWATSTQSIESSSPICLLSLSPSRAAAQFLLLNLQ